MVCVVIRYVSEDCDVSDPLQTHRIFREQGFVEPYGRRLPGGGSGSRTTCPG